MRSIAATMIATLALAACTYEAPVSSTAVAATSIVPGNRSAEPASYFIPPELEQLAGEASGGPCSYPIAIGPALAESLAAVTAKAFPAGATRTTSPAPAIGVSRHLVFALDSFTPDVNLDTRWFSVGYDGRVDLALRVTVQDQGGDVLWTGLVVGNGSATGESAGGCGAGGPVLTNAGNEAMRRLTEDYVAKVINSGVVTGS